jgi:predicted N-acetyltransferase YhbS
MIRDLGGGLVLRRGTPADVEAVAAFNADVLRPQDALEPDGRFAAWTRDLMSGTHPRFTPADATIVADTRAGAIVSSALLVSQTWRVGGIPLSVGQPELIGTHPEYRGRGLVRTQFETIHRWSAEREHQLLAIAGIPWFYRQFGYELALCRGGGPILFTSSIPSVEARTAAAFRVRPMRDADLRFAVETNTRAAGRYLVTVPRDERLWRYELSGRSRASLVCQELRMIETRDGEPVGFLGHAAALAGTALQVFMIELKPAVSWRAVWLSVLSYLLATGESYASRERGGKFGCISFWFLGPGHPLERVFPSQVPSRPTAWYLRVPDLAGFVRAVIPLLDRRLDESTVAGHTGELRLSFYKNGLRLVLERGRVARVDAWPPTTKPIGQEWGMPSADDRRASAMFPDLTFLQLLFGFRALEQLEAAFPDCIVRTGEARALLTALFPPQLSDVWPVV